MVYKQEKKVPKSFDLLLKAVTHDSELFKYSSKHSAPPCVLWREIFSFQKKPFPSDKCHHRIKVITYNIIALLHSQPSTKAMNKLKPWYKIPLQCIRATKMPSLWGFFFLINLSLVSINVNNSMFNDYIKVCYWW